MVPPPGLNGTLMGQSWVLHDSHGISMLPPWDYRGTSMVFPWDFHGTSMGINNATMGHPWDFRGAFMGLSCKFHGFVILP